MRLAEIMGRLIRHASRAIAVVLFLHFSCCGALPHNSACDLLAIVDANTSCSFPFTFNGALYYQCMQSAHCVPVCLTINRITATCSPPTAGFLAQNVTVNVTLSDAVVPLRSVHGWLTILSRVDSGFPLGLNQPYEAGFGDIKSNFWLGLLRIAQLTGSTLNGGHTYRLRIEMIVATDNKWYSVEYNSFRLDAGPAYTLRVSTTATGDIGDCLNYSLSPANNRAFMTSSSAPCVSTRGPFWYTSAGMCCYCGMFGKVGAGAFSWMSQTLTACRWMVQPVN